MAIQIEIGKQNLSERDANFDKPEVSILFLHDEFNLGGVEVLEIKIANFLSDLGNDVIIFCRNGSYNKNISEKIRIINTDGYYDIVEKIQDVVIFNRRVILVSFYPISALAMILLSTRMRVLGFDDVRLFHWVSHSRAFFFSERPTLRWLMRRVFFMIPYQSCYLMNDETLRTHEIYWKSNLKKYPVLRIVGRDPAAFHVARERRKIHIVSVGRLVPFKGYNAQAPFIVRRLLDMGIDVNWDIWGYGPDEAEIRQKSRELKVENVVNVLGSLDHDLFDETVAKHDVFVGMGTALLEAARTGTPAIAALEGGGDECYGFLNETPGDGVGDRIHGHKVETITAALIRFHDMRLLERKKIGLLCSEAAQMRESTIAQFSRSILSSHKAPKVGRIDQAILKIGEAYLKIRHLRRKRMAA